MDFYLGHQGNFDSRQRGNPSVYWGRLSNMHMVQRAHVLPGPEACLLVSLMQQQGNNS